MLAAAEEISRPAQLQILLGNAETVMRGAQRPQTLQRLRTPVVRDENAVGFRLTAADAPAKLMKLGQAETVGVFDHHQSSVRNIHAHLYDRR